MNYEKMAEKIADIVTSKAADERILETYKLADIYYNAYNQALEYFKYKEKQNSALSQFKDDSHEKLNPVERAERLFR